MDRILGFSIDMGRFLEIIRRGDDFEVVFEHGSIGLPRDVVEYVSHYYAIPFHEGFMLLGEPGDPGVRIVEMNGSCYLIIPGLKEGEHITILIKGECSRDFIEEFNKHYKAIWLRLHPESNSMDAIISMGDSEDEAWDNLNEAIIDDMIRWINETKHIEFLLHIASLDPSEAFKVAEEYRRILLEKPGKPRRVKRGRSSS